MEATMKKPEPTNYSRTDINKIAELVAGKLAYPPGEPLEPVVERLGGRINFQNIDDWRASASGSIVVRGPQDFDIYLSKFTSLFRDRFTIAHELGHYILHSNFGEIPLEMERSGSGPMEWEANWFATGLLMPEDKFRRAWEESPRLSYLTSLFMVSDAALEIRIEELGLT